MTFVKKDNPAYRGCPGKEGSDRKCNKKLIDEGNGNYRCVKCDFHTLAFNWRLILNAQVTHSQYDMILNSQLDCRRHWGCLYNILWRARRTAIGFECTRFWCFAWRQRRSIGEGIRESHKWSNFQGKSTCTEGFRIIFYFRNSFWVIAQMLILIKMNSVSALHQLD